MTEGMAWGDDLTRARYVTVFLDNAYMTDQPGEPIATRPHLEEFLNTATDAFSGWECLSTMLLDFAVGVYARTAGPAPAPRMRGGR